MLEICKGTGDACQLNYLNQNNREHIAKKSQISWLHSVSNFCVTSTSYGRGKLEQLIHLLTFFFLLVFFQQIVWKKLLKN